MRSTFDNSADCVPFAIEDNIRRSIGHINPDPNFSAQVCAFEAFAALLQHPQVTRLASCPDIKVELQGLAVLGDKLM